MRKAIPHIPNNAVLRKHELLVALDISEDLLEELVRHQVIPVVYLTPKTPRFIYGQVVRALAKQAAHTGPQLKAVI